MVLYPANKDWYQFQPVIKSNRTQTLSALFHVVLKSYNHDELLEIQPVQNYAWKKQHHMVSLKGHY